MMPYVTVALEISTVFCLLCFLVSFSLVLDPIVKSRVLEIFYRAFLALKCFSGVNLVTVGKSQKHEI